MATYTHRQAALAVDCPLCFAEPGDPCCSEDGANVERVHESRVADLQEVVDRAVRAYADEGIRA